MNAFSTHHINKPLKVTLLFSLFLHATGFYIFSNISFNLTSRSPDVVPIKVTVINQTKEIHSASMSNSPEQKQLQSVHSPKLISTEFKEITTKKPTPIYKNKHLLNPIQKNKKTRNPVAINRIQLTSNHKQSTSRINSKNFFRNELSAISPRFPENDYDIKNNVTYSPTPTKHIGTSRKLILSETVRSRSSSNFKIDGPQDSNPAFMYKSDINEKNAVFSPYVRKISHAQGLSERSINSSMFKSDINKKNTAFSPYVRKVSHAQGLSEGSINSSQITTMVKATPPSINSSSLGLGELRRGFHKKIWQKVAKAKYYPRVARESGFEGEPIVTFTLGSKGELIDLRLIEFSSYQLLNEAALETVRRGIPYPWIPKPLGRDSISFNLPISYVLE